jgi:HAD superfamily hydrolase (TIGR01484 family)
MKSKLVLLDIDGCIMPPNRGEADLNKLIALKNAINSLNNAEISIFTGRSQEYVEFLSQVLGFVNKETEIPFVIENGSALYYPKQKRSEPIIENTQAINKAREILQAQLPKNPFEPKSYIVTINPRKNETVNEFKEVVLKALKQHRLDRFVEVTNSASSVDILSKGANKLFGVRYMIQKFFNEEVFLIAVGDSATDRDVLLQANKAYVPSNASDLLKADISKKFGTTALVDKEHIDAVIYILSLV